MDWLNYHHLLYFWVVAREGSIARACELLELAQPTISHQIHELETHLGHKLFARVGRNIQLTDKGRVVYHYANNIFTIGRELQQTLKGLPQHQPIPFSVGIAGCIPQLVVFRLLEPVWQSAEPFQVSCQTDRPERLLADLALHQLDIVLSDTPAQPVVRVRAYNHLLGECGIAFFGTPELAAQYRPGFPQSLNGAPVLLPPGDSLLRRSLDQWMDSQDIHPVIRGELADSALRELFGRTGSGLFVMPAAVEPDVQQHCGAELVGTVEAVRMRLYAISVQRKLKHPAGALLAQAAREQVFAEKVARDGR